MWRRYKGRCLPARNALGGGAFEAIWMAALFDLRTVTITIFIIYVPYRTPSGRGFQDGFRAVGSGRLIRSPNCCNSCQLMNSSVSPGKTPFLYFESKYPALTRWPIFALRIDDGDAWHTPVYSTTMVSPPYFWLSSRWIVVVSASSSISVISPVPNVMHDIGPPLVKPSSIGI